MIDTLQTAIEQIVERVLSQRTSSQRREKRMVSTKEAAVYIGVSVRTIQNMIANDELPSAAAGRRILIDMYDLDRWIDAQKQKRS